MPAMDGTGPSGQGPKTGRSRGPCGQGMGPGRGRGGLGRGRGGRGLGLGAGRGFQGGTGPSTDNSEALREQQTALEQQLDAVKQRLGELETPAE